VRGNLLFLYLRSAAADADDLLGWLSTKPRRRRRYGHTALLATAGLLLTIESSEEFRGADSPPGLTARVTDWISNRQNREPATLESLWKKRWRPILVAKTPNASQTGSERSRRYRSTRFSFAGIRESRQCRSRGRFPSVCTLRTETCSSPHDTY
jgi:hypothetical protein